MTSKAIIWARNAQRIKIKGVRRLVGSLVNKKPIKTPSTQKTRFKQAWKEFGGKRCFYRSMWEANYGLYLEWQKVNGLIKDWLHEPETFWFEGIRRGCVSYLPDFKVIKNDGTHMWVEVKGFMDSKSKTKIARFKKYFPKETLLVVDSKWYKGNSKKLSLLIPAWEKG